MGKAINAFINQSEENRDERNVVKLTSLDFLHPYGSKDKVIVKKKTRTPHDNIVLAVREVTYLYDKKTSTGWEIVEEILLPRDKENAKIVPKPVAKVTRDLRTKLDA